MFKIKCGVKDIIIIVVVVIIVVAFSPGFMGRSIIFGVIGVFAFFFAFEDLVAFVRDSYIS